MFSKTEDDEVDDEDQAALYKGSEIAETDPSYTAGEQAHEKSKLRKSLRPWTCYKR